jgi:hypothetical protein
LGTSKWSLLRFFGAIAAGGFARIFKAEIAPPMHVKSLPASAGIVQEQDELHRHLVLWLESKFSRAPEEKSNEPLLADGDDIFDARF